MTRLRVKNWAEFQHYRHRRPPWIKLHHGLLDDFAWHRLPEAVTWGFPSFPHIAAARLSLRNSAIKPT
jgi:hypothetical protein